MYRVEPHGAMVLVRGIGDIGSAVAHRLFREGYAVVLHDVPIPTTTRRGMAFADAVFEGHAALEAVHAVRAHDLARVRESLDSHNAIPVYVRDIVPLLANLRPSVLVCQRTDEGDRGGPAQWGCRGARNRRAPTP